MWNTISAVTWRTIHDEYIVADRKFHCATFS